MVKLEGPGRWSPSRPARDPLEQRGLAARQLGGAVHQRHRGPGLRERVRGLHRGVAAAHDQHAATREIAWIVEAVEDLVEGFAGNSEPAELAALADRDDHAPREHLAAALEHHSPQVAALNESVHPCRAWHDARARRLCAELRDQLLLHVRRDLQRALGDEAGRKGVNRFAGREVGERREWLVALEDLARDPEPGQLDRGGHAGDPGAHDRHVDPIARRAPCSSIRRAELARDRARGAGSALERELEEGNPVRSPTMRTPGRFVVPSTPTSGSGSTVPAGQRVCSQRR